MHTQNLERSLKKIHFKVLEKTAAQTPKVVAPGKTMRVKRERNLLLFSIVYGIILGSLIYILVNA